MKVIVLLQEAVFSTVLLQTQKSWEKKQSHDFQLETTPEKKMSDGVNVEQRACWEQSTKGRSEEQVP